MGWFLLGRSAGAKRAARKPVARPAKAAREARPWDPRRLLAVLQVLGAAGLLAGLGVGWRHAEEYLAGYVEAHAAEPPLPSQVILAGRTGWMPPALRGELCTLIANQSGASPLDYESLARAARAFATSPWVEAVERVERLPDGRLRVAANYREPVALVEGSEGFHLVDAKGVQLPGLYPRRQYSAQDIRQVGLPRIIGVGATSPGPGKVWPGAAVAGGDLRAGLALVQLLRDEPYFAQIESFDVGQRDERDRVRLLLRTRGGGMVRWGFAPGQERPIEPDAAVKKERIAAVYRSRRGAIDAGGKIVDVYGGDIFVHQPEPSDSASASASVAEEGRVAVGYTLAR